MQTIDSNRMSFEDSCIQQIFLPLLPVFPILIHRHTYLSLKIRDNLEATQGAIRRAYQTKKFCKDDPPEALLMLHFIFLRSQSQRVIPKIRKLCLNVRFTTTSGHFFANYIIFYKTEVQTVILRCSSLQCFRPSYGPWC